MDTINERVPINEFGKTMNENENSINQSYKGIDDSVRDPSRPAQYVSGLTDFLVDEYYRKFGIYTNDDTELYKLW
jgi:hypothetical protein